MGVAFFDGLMGAYRLGWTKQCYSAFKQGVWWSSHTSMVQGFRPCPAFLAMILRNRHMSGDLPKVEVLNPPIQTFSFPGDSSPGKNTEKLSIPMIGAYAMKDGDQFSVALVNRSLDKSYPVSLEIPAKNARSVTLHTISGNPRDTNLEGLNVCLKNSIIDSDALKDGKIEIAELPPGSVYVYKFLSNEGN